MKFTKKLLTLLKGTLEPQNKGTTEKTQNIEQQRSVNNIQKNAQNIEQQRCVNNKLGNANAVLILFDSVSMNKCKKKFMAFDVETTGLNPNKDKIIEVGAVLVENGTVTKKFQSFINPGISIPQEATEINGITDQMVLTAPDEKNVMEQLCEFFGDAIREQIVICAHNAKFDMDFLCNALRRSGIDAKMYYLDTLKISKELVKGLENYKQTTVAQHFDIKITNAHRASDDAFVCGKIMQQLLYLKCKEIEKKTPNELEEEICRYIQNIITTKGGNIDYLGFQRLSSGHISATYLYSFLKFKCGKSKYFLLAKKEAKKMKLETKASTKTEGEDFVRYYFEKKEDLDIFTEYIFNEFTKTQRSALSYMRGSDNHYDKAMKEIHSFIQYK